MYPGMIFVLHFQLGKMKLREVKWLPKVVQERMAWIHIGGKTSDQESQKRDSGINFGSFADYVALGQAAQFFCASISLPVKWE